MFSRLVKKNKLLLYSISIAEVNRVLSLFCLMPDDLEEKVVTLAVLILVEYYEFLRLFEAKEADCLPPHRPIDHTIRLMHGEQPPFWPLYRMSEADYKFGREYLEKILSRSFMSSSTSSAGSSILLPKNGDCSLNRSVDHQGLHAMTIKNRYPLP